MERVKKTDKTPLMYDQEELSKLRHLVLHVLGPLRSKLKIDFEKLHILEYVNSLWEEIEKLRKWNEDGIPRLVEILFL